MLLVVSNKYAMAQWQPMGGMHYSGLMSFAQSGDTLYCSCQYGSHVFRSINHGKTWEAIIDGLPMNTFITAITAENNILLAGGTSGIYRSTDGGDHWITVDSSVGWGYKFMVSPKYIFYSDGYLMRSSDDGLSWKDCTIFPEAFTQTISIIDTALFVGTNKGLFVSLDWGEHWDTIKGSPKSIKALYMESNLWLVTSENGRLLRSIDEGLSWDTITKQFNSYIKDFYSFTRIGDTIFGSSWFGILKSVDDGKNWAFLDSGLIEKHTTALLVNADLIIAGSYCDWISRSTDRGKTWIRSIGSGESNWTFPARLTSKGTSLFVGSAYGIYRSDDDGKTWIPKNGRRESLLTASLESHPGFLFCMDDYDDGLLYYSSDLGDTWIPINIFAGSNFTVIDGVFYLTRQSSLLLRSSDFGQSWAIITIDGLALDAARFYKVASSVFAYGYNSSAKLAHSEDKGLHWTLLHSFDSIQAQITTLASTDSTIFLGTFDSGIYRSSDFGMSWVQVNNGLGNLQIQTILSEGNMLYAGTRRGVFYSWNSGKSWRAMNEGLLDSSVNALLVYKGYLYMAGDNVQQSSIPSYGGVYRYPLEKLSVENEIQVNPSVANISVSPNPFTTQTTISFTSPESQPMQFEIFDILGKKIYYSGEKLYTKGENTITLNTTEFPDGFLYGRFTSSSGISQSIKLFKLQSQR
jgi:photosystem II stability/assembly factor-like uncharacterized protein